MNKWEILNKLFGWDYVNFTPRTASYYGSNINGGNYRLRIGYNGEVFFYMDGRAMSITDKDSVIWLTCKPSKYLKELLWTN